MTIQLFIFTITISLKKWNRIDIEKEYQHHCRKKELNQSNEKFRHIQHYYR